MEDKNKKENEKDFFYVDRRIVIPNEIAYVIALLLNALGVAMVTASDFGLSMIVAPAYILSLKLGISFGFAEYIVQAIMFVLLLLIIRKFKVTYLWSFLTCVLYGAVLNLFQMIPIFNSEIFPPESFEMWARVLFYIGGLLIIGLAIAIYLRTYLHPMVYDFFVSAITKRYHLKVTKFKLIFDFSMLFISIFMAMLLFHSWQGLGWGTIVSAIFNGFIIGHIGVFLDKKIVFAPMWPKHAERFKI